MKCPFCQASNNCAFESNPSCWCFAISIPKDMLVLLSPDDQDSVCVCQACVKLYEKDKDKFLQRFNLA